MKDLKRYIIAMQAFLSVLCGSIGLVAMLGGCAGSPAPAAEASPSVRAPAPSVIDPATVVHSTEAWSYAGRPGRAIHTAHYRFYLTQTDPIMVNRLPLFMETAMSFYRNSFAGLPAPPGKLDTFLMGTRGQWETLTRQLMGDQAETYLRIQRGGFASGGRGVFYDIGAADTLSIASHEGWHQYTQRTFAEPLPIWLEEGIATTMEGYRWENSGPVILTWSNTERFDQLRAAAADGTLMPLATIFDTSPQELISVPTAAQAKADPQVARRTPDAALTYYAQIWVLVHFLQEAEDGKYRNALQQCVNDAAAGRMGDILSERLGDRAGRSTLLRRKGPGVALAYFNADLNQMAQEYARFVEVVVRPGSRGPVVEGKSPLGVN